MTYSGFLYRNVDGKNKVTRNLSASVIEKINGYKMMRQQLSHKEKIDLITINILSLKSYIARFDKGKEHIVNCAVRQCHYCQSFFEKNNEAMTKHLEI